jgi:hypothetical protein
VEDFELAILGIWDARLDAAERAAAKGNLDKSLRAGVVAGKHLDAVGLHIGSVFVDAGLPTESVLFKRGEVVLPGYFRATKQWDIVVVHEGLLVAAVELKSMLGSVGKNLNNRMEESIGSAADLQQAAEAGLLGDAPPWLGYAYVLEDLDDAKVPREVSERHFPVDPAFHDASYERRMALYLRRLVAKRFYDAAWFVVGNPKTKVVREPAEDLTWSKFEAAIRGRVAYVLA